MIYRTNCKLLCLCMLFILNHYGILCVLIIQKKALFSSSPSKFVMRCILIHIYISIQVDIWEERKVFNPRGQTLKEELLGRNKNGKNISYKLVKFITPCNDQKFVAHLFFMPALIAEVCVLFIDIFRNNREICLQSSL